MLSLTYLSTATTSFSAPQLDTLLANARPRNEADGLTGLLLYADGHFIQTLEGSADAVDGTFSRICRDGRHRNVFLALRDDVEERSFPDWSMGYRAVDSEVAATLPGFSDYLDGGTPTERQRRDLGSAGTFHRVFRDTLR